MAQTYSFKDYNKDNMARASGRSLPISFKQSIEICNLIRGKQIAFAKNALNDAIDKKKAIPFKRFNGDTGHKKEMAAGRYPKKASKEILDILNLVEANAQFKGLNTSNLVINHITANKASTSTKYGRKRGRKSKRTSIEIIVNESAPSKKEVKGKKEVKPKEAKVEMKEIKKVPEAKNAPVEKKATAKPEVTKGDAKVEMKKVEKDLEVKKESVAEKPAEARKTESKAEVKNQDIEKCVD